MSEIILKTEHLSKNYQMGEIVVRALRDATFEIYEGEFMVILGPSGSGKSTLLNLLGGMDSPSEGRIYMRGDDITEYSERQLTEYRRKKVGFVFQFYNIMASLTAEENVELATEIADDPLDIGEIMDDVGLGDRRAHFPSQLSGGEQQRVSIARAVAKNPEILLCDEPTGALDYTSGVSILVLLKKVNKQLGKTVVVITHNIAIAEMADRVLKMRSGEITEIYSNAEPLPPERIQW